jgi:hypothetical protein
VKKGIRFNEIYQSRICRANIDVPRRLIAGFASAMVQRVHDAVHRIDPTSGAVSPVRGTMGMGVAAEEVVGMVCGEAKQLRVRREFLGIRNSVVRLSVGLSADARSRGLQAGSRSVDFRGRCPRFCLVGVARDKSESLRSRNRQKKGVDLPGTNGWFMLYLA